ncbi:uncharacterized protein BN805_01891 [Prevotella sp. CAG:891]|nr:uncharacterized protein BN805_01891 [Prevotella sp. CAG:891]
MNTPKTYSLGPFAVLTFIYFIVGFLTTVNGQFQGPLKIAFLSEADELRNTLTTLISFFFFLGYLVNSSLGGRWINAHGYKPTLLRALGVMIGGLLMYALSSLFVSLFPHAAVRIGQDSVSYGYFIFLIGSFLMGTSAALLQVVINPYIAAYELPNTQPVQRVNIVCAINSLGTTIAPFFVTGVIFSGVSLSEVTSDQLLIPFLLIALSIVLTTLVTSRLALPDLAGTRSVLPQTQQRSIWSFRHLTLGVIAIFFYVGTEVSIGVNVNLHAMEQIEAGMGLNFLGKHHLMLWGLDFGIPALLATLYWGGLMVGRIIFSFFNNISSRVMLTGTTIVATLLIFVAMLTNNLWVLISVGLCHSVMWGCIFTLAVKGLGEYTSKASGVFMMGVFGGAVIPLLQGVLADALGSWQWTWTLALGCELVMLAYALWGSKVHETNECGN